MLQPHEERYARGEQVESLPLAKPEERRDRLSRDLQISDASSVAWR